MAITRRSLLRGACALGSALALGACGAGEKDAGSSSADAASGVIVRERTADPIARAKATHVDAVGDLGRTKAFDLHCDTVDVLGMHDWEPYRSWPAIARHGDLAKSDGEVDLERAQGLAYAQGFSVWVPDRKWVTDPLGFYTAAVAYFRQQMRQHADRVEQVTDARRIPDVLRAGKVAAVLTVESCSALEGSIDVVDTMREDGVRMAGLTWNGDNALGGGRSTRNGLTELGKRAVARLEDAGIAVDAAHLSAESFDDLVRCRRRPFLISHCASRAVCDVDRNVTDDQFKAVLDSGGVVGVSYCTEFITKRTTGTDVTFDELMAHFEHFLDLGGEDCVCLGGDFDGASVPDWLRGVDKLQGFYQKVCERLGQGQADKVFFQNAYAFMVRNEVA